MVWYSELARRILPRPTPTPAGDKPLASRSLRPHYIPHSPPLWIPAPYRGSGSAFAGETKWGRRVEVGGGIAVDVVSRNVSAWIPAFAGMTNVGVRWRTRKPFKGIFVPMTGAGDSRVCRNDGARRNDAVGGGIRRLVLPVGWAHPTVPYV